MNRLIQVFLLFLAICASLPLISQDETIQKPQETVQTPAPQGEGIDQPFDLGAPAVSYQGAFVKMMMTLLGLILLIIISVWMLRRVSQGRMKQMNYGRSIKVLERRPLSAKSVLYLVEISGKKVVVSESQLEVRTIATLDTLPEED